MSRTAQASPVPAQTMSGLRLRDGERADRLRGLVVEGRLPGRAAVGGFPDAARRGAGVIDAGLPGDGRRRGDSSGAGRADVFEARGARRLLWTCRRRPTCAWHSRHPTTHKPKPFPKRSFYLTSHIQTKRAPPASFWVFFGRPGPAALGEGRRRDRSAGPHGEGSSLLASLPAWECDGP